MKDFPWQKVETIIDQVLDLPPEKRASFIEKQCKGDQKLKGEVTQLLESIVDSEGWLENPHEYKEDFLSEIIDDVEALPSDDSLIGKKVGAYSVKEQIGQGGMGSVYLAERTDDEFQHNVAIKIIRHGQATETNIRRFKREQQILANLNHSGIATLLDGGVTDDGLLYIIMEYVDGMPISKYCEHHSCTTDEKIELFKQVLKAVRHAHENLIIHRDLKPNNILVDKSGNVKILDFGISKLLEDDSDLSLTQTGMRLLTPKYAAPEQIRHEKITTSCDLYALGMIFYEILAGTLPFDFEELSRYEMEQTILHNEPLRPSKKVNAIDAQKQLKGDLDAIVLKAIRKNAKDRYQGITALLDDIRNYQENLPVNAQKGGTTYHINKFLRRHKKGLIAATGALLLLIGLTAFYTWRIAEERNQAQLEAQKATQAKNFLVNILQNSDPFTDTSDPDLTLKEVLDNGAKRIQTELQGYPALQADLLLTVGLIYENLALYPKAEAILTEALKLHSQLPEEDIQLKGDILQQLSASMMWQGKFAESDSILQDINTLFIENYGSDARLSPIYNDWGLLMQEWGKLDRAEELYKQSIQLADLGFIDTTSFATTYHNLATVFKDQGKLDSAVAYYNKTLELRYKSVSEWHPGTATTLSLLASALHAKGKLLKADSLHRKALRIRMQTLPPQHPHIAASQTRLGQVLLKLGKPNQTEKLLTKAIPILLNSFPEHHWRVRAAEGVLAVSWMLQGQLKKAEQPLLNALQTFTDRFGVKDWRTQEALTALVRLYSAWDKPQLEMKYKKQLLSKAQS